jgi:Family of unknown function (DUF6112)
VSALKSPVQLPFAPNLTGLPGSAALVKLINGLEGWALVLALGALVAGAAAWALGAHSHNVHQSTAGRRAVLAAGAAALLIGAAPALVRFFFDIGQSVR